jgi:CTP synthase
MAVIEYSRNVLKLTNANSVEMDEHTPDPVISLMESQKDVVDMGGTMRLGAWDCELQGGKVAQIYGTANISERHRHRYEYNNDYRAQLEAAGLSTTGINPKTGLVEIVEIPAHPWFVGVQFHPEYKSTVANPHPLFISFVAAAAQYKSSK